MEMKLALHIIAKDELGKLRNIVRRYDSFFDEIVIGYDSDNIDVVRGELYEISNKVKVLAYKWRDDFAHKRNYVAKYTDSEYYLRLDTDDFIEKPQLIRELFDKAVKNDVDVVYCPYMYSSDNDGNCNVKHWRETIVKKSDNHYWKKSIHENIFVEDLTKYKGIKDGSLKIIHNVEPDHAVKSAERNFKILVKEYEKDKENTDPRTLAYLGRMLMGYGKWQEASVILELFISKSGWDEDKYFAWCQLAECNLQLDKYDIAIAAANEALAIRTDYPDAYLVLLDIYLQKGDYDKAIDWGITGLKKKEPDTLYVIDPTKYTYKGCFKLSLAFFHKGDIDSAKLMFDKAYNFAPTDETILKYGEIINEAYENNTAFKHYLWLVQYLKTYKADALKSLADTIPDRLLKDERFLRLKVDSKDPEVWSDKSVIIFCGNSWEEWSPVSTIKGIGGSEEAVIYLSKELVKLGYEVTVYNNCGEMAGEYEGVKYKSFFEFNPNDVFNVLISWRSNIFKLNTKLRAKRKLVWLHDVPNKDQFIDGSEFDKVIVLSEYHKSLLPDSIPEEKIYVSSNGINLEDFKALGEIRNPQRLIYTSSYDRGIQHLLILWSDIKLQVPEAELHLFYGWNTYLEMEKSGARDPKFRHAMETLMKQNGVFEHGRIGHKKLNKEFQKSGIWVYPSHFEEISCISAMKAQANGCVPVCTNYAALAETVKDGVIIDGKCGNKETDEKFKDELIKILKNKKKQADLRKSVLKHKESFGWNNVAGQWSKDLF